MINRLIVIFVLLFACLKADTLPVQSITPPTIVINSEKLILVVECNGDLPLKYQWYRNNIRIVGQTSKNCTISDPGLYYVIVSNAGGSITSGKVRLVDETNDNTASIIITRKKAK